MKLAILNTAILTSAGSYDYRPIPLTEAAGLVREMEIDSAVGHQSTAEILTTLLGREIPVNRQLFIQQPGQRALVFKLRGRAPEGVILTAKEIEAIGFDFFLLTRLT